MGRTIKNTHDRYTLAFKLQAVRLSDHPDVSAKAVAEGLGIHPVMLYRWRMEARNGTLVENKHMKATPPSPKRVNRSVDPAANTEADLAKAAKRIKELEKALAQREEELDILKKAQRFFEKNRQ